MRPLALLFLFSRKAHVALSSLFYAPFSFLGFLYLALFLLSIAAAAALFWYSGLLAGAPHDYMWFCLLPPNSGSSLIFGFSLRRRAGDTDERVRGLRRRDGFTQLSRFP